jgi:hypothetical protein
MSTKDSARRVVMSKEVAEKWLLQQAKPEYRVRVFNSNAKNYVGLLRSFRDGKVKLAGVSPLPDLGVKEDFDGFYVWSSNQEALKTLQCFFEQRGLETSWIW